MTDNPFSEPEDSDRTVIRPMPGGRKPSGAGGTDAAKCFAFRFAIIRCFAVRCGATGGWLCGAIAIAVLCADAARAERRAGDDRDGRLAAGRRRGAAAAIAGAAAQHA